LSTQDSPEKIDKDSLPRLVILISGGGGLMKRTLSLCRSSIVPAITDRVISSRPDNKGIRIAQELGATAHVVNRKDYKGVADFSEAVWRIIDKQNHIFGVLMLGWLPLLHIPDQWKNRVINTHPSLLPLFGGKGMFGHKVHEAVLKTGVFVTGFTFHFVDHIYDHGPIIHQSPVEVRADDTPSSLEQRVIHAQHSMLPELLRLWVTGTLRIEEGKIMGAPPPRWFPAKSYQEVEL
jgi:folate-dependent phosphoribosylglycinamide formyltransferase PurN